MYQPQQLAEKLGYTFNDIQLLLFALSHRSASIKSNERLEFLGDSILNFIIAAALYELSPKAQEGELSRLRASLVREEALAELATRFELGHYLRLGIGEMKTGGAWRQSILADAMEAVIGAIYLDSGFEQCKTLVLHWYQDKLGEVSQNKIQIKDSKTLLQEYLQGRRYPLPIYTILNMQGAMHEQIFTIQCTVAGLPHVTTGKGTSRRKAEQAAAAEYLILLNTAIKNPKKVT